MASGGVGKEEQSPFLSSFRIKVTQVIDPHNFYAQLGFIEDFAKFTEFETLVNKYCADQCPSSVTEANLQQRELVFTKHETGSWRRAVVAAIFPDPGEADVFHMDYGTTEIVSEVVTPMPHNYLTTIPRAVRCKLAGIAPISKSWISRAINNFKDLVVDKLLTARVIAEENGIYCVDIFLGLDTNSSVRQVMMNEGIAQPAEFEKVVLPLDLAGVDDADFHQLGLSAQQLLTSIANEDLYRNTMPADSNAPEPSLSESLLEADARALMPDSYFDPNSKRSPEEQISTDIDIKEALASLGLDTSTSLTSLWDDHYKTGDEVVANISMIENQIDQVTKRNYVKETDTRLDTIKLSSPSSRRSSLGSPKTGHSPARNSPKHPFEKPTVKPLGVNSPLLSHDQAPRSNDPSPLHFSPLSTDGKNRVQMTGSSFERNTPSTISGYLDCDFTPETNGSLNQTTRDSLASARDLETRYEKIRQSFCAEVSKLLVEVTQASAPDCVQRLKQLIYPAVSSFAMLPGEKETFLVLECLTDKAILEPEFCGIYQFVLQQLQDCLNFAESFVRVLKKMQSDYVKATPNSNAPLNFAELLGSVYMWSQDWCEDSQSAVQNHVMRTIDVWVIFNKGGQHPNPDKLQMLYTDCLAATFNIAGSSMYNNHKDLMEKLFEELTEKIRSTILSKPTIEKILKLMMMKQYWDMADQQSVPHDNTALITQDTQGAQTHVNLYSDRGPGLEDDQDIVVEEEEIQEEDSYKQVKQMLKELKMMQLYEVFEENAIRDSLLDIEFADLKDLLKECGLKIGQITEIKMYLKKRAKKNLVAPTQFLVDTSIENPTKTKLISPAHFMSTSSSKLQGDSPSDTLITLCQSQGRATDIFKQPKDDLSDVFSQENSKVEFSLPSFSRAPGSVSRTMSTDSKQSDVDNSNFAQPESDFGVGPTFDGQHNSMTCLVPERYDGSKLITMNPDVTMKADGDNYAVTDIVSSAIHVLTNENLSGVNPEEEKEADSANRAVQKNFRGGVDQAESISALDQPQSVSLLDDAAGSSLANDEDITDATVSVSSNPSTNVDLSSFDPMSVFKCLFDSPQKDDNEGISRQSSSSSSGDPPSSSWPTSLDFNDPPLLSKFGNMENKDLGKFPDWSFDIQKAPIKPSAFKSPNLNASANKTSSASSVNGNQSYAALLASANPFKDAFPNSHNTMGDVNRFSKDFSTYRPESGDHVNMALQPDIMPPWNRSVPVPPTASKISTSGLGYISTPSSSVVDFSPGFSTQAKRSEHMVQKTQAEDKIPSYADAISAKRSGAKYDQQTERGDSKKGGMTVLGKVHSGSSNRNATSSSVTSQKMPVRGKTCANGQTDSERSKSTLEVSQDSPSESSSSRPFKCSTTNSGSFGGQFTSSLKIQDIRQTGPPEVNPRAHLLLSPGRRERAWAEPLWFEPDDTRPAKHGFGRAVIKNTSMESNDKQTSSGAAHDPKSNIWGVKQNSPGKSVMANSSLDKSGFMDQSNSTKTKSPPKGKPSMQKDKDWWSPDHAPSKTAAKKSLEEEILEKYSKQNYGEYKDDFTFSDSSSSNDDFVIIEGDFEKIASEAHVKQEEFPSLSTANQHKDAKSQETQTAQAPVVLSKPTEPRPAFGAKRKCVICGMEDHLSYNCPERKHKFFFGS